MATAATLKLSFLPSVLNAIAQHNLTGSLTATNDDNLIKFYFNHGQLYDAQQSRPVEVQGYDALYAILSWQNGELSWSQDVSTFSSLDTHQVGVFNKAVIMLFKTPDEAATSEIPPAFFHPATSQDWAAIMRDGQHAYQHIAATQTNYERVIKAFATSQRTGLVQLCLGELETFYLFEQGHELGKYYRQDEPPYFQPDFSSWSLLDQPGSLMEVYLATVATQSNTPAPNPNPSSVIPTTPAPILTEPDNQDDEDVDENNPYDF